MLKVAIDTKPLKTGHSVRGIGVYTRNLIEALKKRKDIKISTGNWRLETGNYDLVHYPYFDIFFPTLKVDSNIPTVVTVYDVIPLLYSAHYPPGIKGRINFLRQKRQLKKVKAVITISETSRKDIVRFLDIPQERIYPIHLAASPSFKKLATGNWRLETTKRYGLPERFVLYVGDVNYNKNVLGLAKACKKIDIPLVIVGKQAVSDDFDKSHPENQPLVHLIEEYGNDPDIVRLGFVPDGDLVKIYNLATVYCQPSFYEGFGLPVLEAMASSIPVVAAKTQALVEIAENKAVFVDPKNTDGIARGLEMVVKDRKLQVELSKKGLEHVKKFSWRKVADETVKVYEKAVS